MEYIRKAVSSFNSCGIDKYINVTTIKKVKAEHSAVDIDLRYGGRSIATLTVKGNHRDLTIKKTANYFFPAGQQLVDSDKKSKKVAWISEDATKFRKNFISKPKTVNNEHFYESQWLQNLEKPTSRDKAIINIQPVEYAKCRIQFPSFISAKDAHKDLVTISLKANGTAAHGGGIDILAIRRQGRNSYLSVIELKDDIDNSAEKPEDAIKQAIAYATFIDFILRKLNSKTNPQASENWMKIFKSRSKNKKPLEKAITILAVINIPKGKNNNTNFINTEPNLVFPSGDKLQLHYIYFDKDKLKKGRLTSSDIITSLQK